MMRECIRKLSINSFLASTLGFFTLAATAMWLPAHAETLQQALSAAYVDNPDLNAERASVRAIDENVSQALSTGRPTVLGTADASIQDSDSRNTIPPINFNRTSHPRGFAITISQPIFRGFRIVNSVRQAEALVRAARSGLDNSEQNILFTAVEAYMNVVRNSSIVTLNRNNVAVLNEQLRATRDRFSVGEVTRTDVAQAEARVALAASLLSLADSQLATSRAIYQQIIGNMPAGVSQPRSIDHLLPNSLADAMGIGDVDHPAIQASLHAQDAAGFAVDVNKGAMLPEVDVEASWTNRWDAGPTTPRNSTGKITGRVTVPIYQRGQVASTIRQSLETETQRMIEVQAARNQVRAAVVSAWGVLQAVRAQILSDQAQVEANKVALDGVREENKVGQRTVLDVLDAEQVLLDSRVALVTTERDRIVAAYALLSAIGKLNARTLALHVSLYDPNIHYNNVRNRWFGINT
ncbi:MAG: TolC family outer membrane protein, partial [Fimbriimonadaceae bacterium]|nr:TolC family outer membrane protein [Alphaproteobacteria bacterium]